MKTTRIAQLTFAFATLLLSSASAQPAEWTETLILGVNNPNDATLLGQQVRLVVDTASLVSAGKMAADGRDVRFAPSCDGSTSLPYWIEPSSINTKSDLSVFDGDAELENAPLVASKSMQGGRLGPRPPNCPRRERWAMRPRAGRHGWPIWGAPAACKRQV